MGVTVEKRVANVSLTMVATRFSSFAECGSVKKSKLCINAIKNFIYAEFFIIFQMLVRHGGSA